MGSFKLEDYYIPLHILYVRFWFGGVPCRGSKKVGKHRSILHDSQAAGGCAVRSNRRTWIKSTHL